MDNQQSKFGKFRLRDDIDETGASKKADFAPGSIFLARKTTSVEETQEPIASTSKPISSEMAGLKKSRKSTDFKNGNLKNKKDSSTSNPQPKKAGDVCDSKNEQLPKKIDSGKKETLSKASTTKRVPFNKLFDGVIFVLSGFQNPTRSELRDQALAMGAQYRADWGPGCTHLICAFANTPKYNQVRGKGKIVKKAWILDSYKARMKMPGKRYAFDETEHQFSDEDTLPVADDANATSTKVILHSADIKPPSFSLSQNKNPVKNGQKDRKETVKNSDDKIPTSDDVYNAPTDYSDQESSDDTDGEIQRVRANKRKLTDQTSASTSTSTKPKSRKIDLMDDELLPELPTFFADWHFFIYGAISNEERKQLQRFIVAYNGVLEDYMNNKVTHVLTREQWDESFDEALRDFPKIIFLNPDFVLACRKAEKFIDIGQYEIKKHV